MDDGETKDRGPSLPAPVATGEQRGCLAEFWAGRQMTRLSRHCFFLEAEFPASAAAAELHDSIFHLSPPAGERVVTTQESLMDAREREPLTRAKLLPPPKLSSGPFGSESR